MGKTLFISDLHFGHKNILSLDNRPFSTIEEHDEHLIKKWNEAVDYDDTVYILGDISWYNVTKTINILQQLNGSKYLIVGNHDKKLLKNKDFRSMFCEIVDYKEITYENGKGIVLSHYPIPCFNNHYYGWYHLYGHVHSGWEWNIMKHVKHDMENLYDKPCEMYNVGAMLPYMQFKPKTLNEIIENSKEKRITY